ncbi:MAG: hypothetical protein JJ892_09975 [Balneola sp.]|jgi:hypothetical protein|nr:hypothetical protein [Balneola sp.]MBO6649474.1 hypothetical protein [Balneola sp.]MBO6711290.1 hypothetical protein [Balneola sp.]MBO6800595.1 hypothetical protein [Balneola sp.]MBO6869226.1 hypothetical protein [Balneola sp.]
MISQNWQQKISSFLSLFTSTGTLICCALPALIATFAGGAAVTSMITNFPWLVPLSENKGWIFTIAGAMLILSGVLIYRPKGKLSCSITGGKGCEIAGRFTKIMFWFSLSIFSIGVFFAYLFYPIIQVLGF